MNPIHPATKEQQEYVDKASHYAGRAVICYSHELWTEAANHFGSALESLLRARYGHRPKLAALIEKFDADDLFNDVIIHDGMGELCKTCYADRVRVLRNSVHPDCWIAATQRDVNNSATLVLLIFHTLVKCETRIAEFQDSPDPSLKMMEAGKLLFITAPLDEESEEAQQTP